jgi:DNA-binding NtrC family response regulator
MIRGLRDAPARRRAADEAAVSILIVEDKDSLRRMLRKTLEAEGHEVEEAADGARALELLGSRRFEMVLTDLRLPGADGLAVLEGALAADPEVPVVVMTAYGTMDVAVQAMKLGARDVLAKPVEPDHLVLLVKRTTEQRRLRRENLALKDALADRLGAPEIVGESPEIRTVAEACRRVAGADATVLLLGESGTGKELFARAIHHLSPRRDGPFVALNCAAIPETLLENELFGHEKGAYTGAGEARAGKFELAEGGTLFLDEIGDLSAAVQAKLLRALQERTFERVGGTVTIRVDVRIVAATNKDLKSDVAAGRFREDLWFRLSVFPVEIPPLSRRKGDVPLLAERFLEKAASRLGRQGLSLGPEARQALQRHDWPGNVRELENTIERAAILADGPEISVSDLGLGAAPAAAKDRIRDLVDFDGSLSEVSGRAAALVESLKVRDALLESGGNKTQAARILDVSYKTLLNKMREHGLK